VLQIAEDFQPFFDCGPRFSAIHPRYEAEAAGIVFISGVVKAGSWGQQVASFG
jgi:hypothetical protein